MIVTHKNLKPLLKKLQHEPEFQIGNKSYQPTGDEWYRQRVCLEFPSGEAARDGLATLALIGTANYETTGLTGKEGFDAQGLEGKIVVRKDFFSALMNMRDILPVNRGRIILK